MHKLPMARKDNLIVERAGDEVVVYDLERHKAHCLNPVSAQVWSLCDGQTEVEGMTQAVTAPGADEARLLVEQALAQLSSAHLLMEKYDETKRIGRRELLKRAGIAAAAVPLITTLVAPKPAMAASAKSGCVNVAGVCRRTGDCCAGLVCTGGHCTPRIG